MMITSTAYEKGMPEICKFYGIRNTGMSCLATGNLRVNTSSLIVSRHWNKFTNTALQKAEPLDGTVVCLLYAGGGSATLDIEPALHGPIFEPVKTPDYFPPFQIESDTLRWPNGADIDPGVLRLWAKKGKC